MSATRSGVPLRHRLRAYIPGGVLPVTAGMAVSAGSAYVFLVIAARVLGAQRYAPLAAFWSLVMIVGPGTFSALERDVAHRLSLGKDPHGSPVVRYGAVIGGAIVLILVFAAVLAIRQVQTAFNGNDLLIGGLVASFPFYCVEYLMLGLAIGTSSMSSYGLIIGSEGFIRLVGAVVLSVAGMATIGSFGLTVVAGTACAGALGLVLLRRSASRAGRVPFTTMVVACLWQLLAILLLNVLINAGPLLVKLLASGAEQRLAAPFLSALVLVRVPLLVWASAGPSLLGTLSRMVGEDRRMELRQYLRRLYVAIFGVGILSVLLSFGIGPMVLRLAFGAGFVLPRWDMAALAATSTALILTATLSLVLTSLRRERAMVASLAAGVVVLAIAVASMSALLQRVELGLLLGASAAALGMLVIVRRSVVPMAGQPTTEAVATL